MAAMNAALVLMSIPLFCFASATVIEIRRDRSSLKHLARILPLAIAAVASILLLSFVFDSADFPSNRFCTTMSLTGLLVAACGFLCRYKSQLATVLLVVGGLFLAYLWLISRVRA
jgi:hypothetical protein